MNAQQMLEASNSDWMINLELLRTIKLTMETKFCEYSYDKRNPRSQIIPQTRKPLSWASIGFSSNDEPEIDIKEVGLLGLLLLLDLIETNPALAV